jgi:integrase
MIGPSQRSGTKERLGPEHARRSGFDERATGFDKPVPNSVEGLRDKGRACQRVREGLHRNGVKDSGSAKFFWIKRFIFFHNKHHPAEMGEGEVARFLSSLASDSHVSASTQNQALNALLFLYREVLGKEIGYVDGVVRAKRPHRLPVVLTRQEVKSILSLLDGVEWIAATLLYGAGLRLMECLRLRVKDIDFFSN